jgi:hypothetical protein
MDPNAAAKMAAAGWTPETLAEARWRGDDRVPVNAAAQAIDAARGRTSDPLAPPPPPPAITIEGLRGMTRKEQRKAATERWPEVQAALAGKPPPGQPLSAAERADLAKVSPERLAERWDEVAETLAAGGGKPPKGARA